MNYEKTVRRRIEAGELANASEFIRHCIRVAEAVEARSGPAGASFTTREQLESLLLDATRTEAEPMTEARRANLYGKVRRRE